MRTLGETRMRAPSRVVLLSLLALILQAACGANPPLQIPAPPAIKSFKAASNEISPGESVALSFEAVGATEAQLVDQTGAAIPFEGTASSGEATVTPASTTFYVL